MLIRSFRNRHKQKLEDNFMTVWERSNRAGSGQEEGDREKIVPFCKKGLKVRTVRKARVRVFRLSVHMKKR